MIVFLIILEALLIILITPISAEFYYESALNKLDDNKDLSELKIKFGIFPIKLSSDKKKKKNNNSSEKNGDGALSIITDFISYADEKLNPKPRDKTNAKRYKNNKKKKNFLENYLKDSSLSSVINLIKSAGDSTKKLFKSIRIRDVYVDLIAGGSDAANAAKNYGTAAIALTAAINVLETYFSAKIKEINLEADFNSEETNAFVYFVASINLIALLARLIEIIIKLAPSLNINLFARKRKSKGIIRNGG